MNKTVSAILLFCLFNIPLFLSAQISVATRLGVNSFSEINIELTASQEKKVTLYTSMSYFYRGFNLGGLGCGTLWPSPLYDKGNKGLGLKFGMSYSKIKTKRNKQKIRNTTLSILYRRFEGTIRQNESGCGDFWLNYNFIANDVGFYIHKDYNINKPVNFYWAVGMVQRFRNQDRISPNGSVSDSEVISQIRLLIDLGFRIRLVKI